MSKKTRRENPVDRRALIVGARLSPVVQTPRRPSNPDDPNGWPPHMTLGDKLHRIAQLNPAMLHAIETIVDDWLIWQCPWPPARRGGHGSYRKARNDLAISVDSGPILPPFTGGAIGTPSAPSPPTG